MKSSEINELAAALVTAQSEFPSVSKDASNPFFKSKYADLAAVVKTAAPVLAKNKLAVTQWITGDGEKHYLTTYLLHSSGQFIAHDMELLLAKQDPQGQGSAVTYARRYSYMAALGLVADEDDDGNAASNPKTQAAPKSALEAVQKPVGGTAPQKPDTALIHPALMTELRKAFKAAQITGDAATIFVRTKIDKPTPTTNDEAQKLIDALHELTDTQLDFKEML